jgi:hypothetical protein
MLNLSEDFYCNEFDYFKAQRAIVRAPCSIAWRNAARHRSRRHSCARAILRRSGSTSAAREQPWPHSLPTIRRVLLPIVPASAVARRHARTRMGLSRPQHLPDRVPRYLQVTGDLLDRLALDEVLTP